MYGLFVDDTIPPLLLVPLMSLSSEACPDLFGGGDQTS